MKQRQNKTLFCFAGTPRVRRMGGDGRASFGDSLQDRRDEDDGQVADGPEERHHLGAEDVSDVERVHILQGRSARRRKAQVRIG